MLKHLNPPGLLKLRLAQVETNPTLWGKVMRFCGNQAHFLKIALISSHCGEFHDSMFCLMPATMVQYTFHHVPRSASHLGLGRALSCAPGQVEWCFSWTTRRCFALGFHERRFSNTGRHGDPLRLVGLLEAEHEASEDPWSLRKGRSSFKTAAELIGSIQLPF